MIGKVAEQPAPNRTNDETESEQDRGVELLNDRVAAWKERARKIQRKRCVRVKVVPLDEIADRADENGSEPTPDVAQIEVVGIGERRGGERLYGRVPPVAIMPS